MNVQPTILYRVTTTVVVSPNVGPFLVLEPGTIVWQHGRRASCCGGYIATCSLTYRQAYGLSPVDRTFLISADNLEVE